MKRGVGTQRILTAQMKCPVGSLSIYLFLFNLNGGKEGGFLIKKIKYYIL